jgi:hypothetical protein
MSSCAAERDHILTLIEPQAHVHCSAYEAPRRCLPELQVKAYAAAHPPLIEQCLAGEEQGLRLKKAEQMLAAVKD